MIGRVAKCSNPIFDLHDPPARPTITQQSLNDSLRRTASMSPKKVAPISMVPEIPWKSKGNQMKPITFIDK